MRPSTGISRRRRSAIGAAATLKRRRTNNYYHYRREDLAFFVFCCCIFAIPMKALMDWIVSQTFSPATVEVKQHSYTEEGLIINGDPKCVKTKSPIGSPFGRAADNLQLGPCAYFFEEKQAPPGGWLHDIDYFFDRPGQQLEAKEQCYLDCLRGLAEDEITPSFLIRAAQMKLPKVVQTLMDDYGMDPLYKVKSTDGIPRLNAVQEAVHGGYPVVLKTLTRGNIKLVIDNYGRTVEDYITMRASPIRPFHALKYFGIKVPETNLSPLIAFNDTEFEKLEERQGWTSKTDYPHEYDNTCDIDVVNELSREEFYREYLLPGRPVLIRDQAADDELQAFSKKYWQTTTDFHPSSKHKVGPTAYPSLTDQKACDTKLSISEMENATECPTMPGIPMVHARHPTNRDLELLYPATNGEVLNPTHSWAKLTEFFHVHSHRKHRMQLFWGGDGSGATFHWHLSAFNILYAGLKEWRLAPPLFRGYTGMPASKVQLDASFSLKCTQKPGDLLWFPDYWGHMTINHRFSIGAAIIHGGYRDLNVEPEMRARDDALHNTASERETIETLVPRHDEQAPAKTEAEVPDFFFVHINKCGGSSMISMLNERCPGQWRNEKWSSPALLRTFHCSAQCWIDRWGGKAWNDQYSFAIVRHPLARAVSNFFFLIDQCSKKRSKICEERAISTHYNGVVINDLADDELKINLFHSWVEKAYKLFPPGSHNHHLFGSHAHNNDVYSTFNATMTSWMVNADGEIAVDEVYRLEEMASGGMDKLSTKIPCLKNAATASERFLAEQEQEESTEEHPHLPAQQQHVQLATKNTSPPYPDYERFAANRRTKEIFLEVYAADFHNFGYKWPDPSRLQVQASE